MLLSALFASLVVALAAALVHRQALVRAQREELAGLEDEMTAAVEERYQAYLGLETKVRRILARLNELDAQTTAGLARTGLRLRDLDRALTACDGPAENTVENTSESAQPQPPESRVEPQRAPAVSAAVDPELDIAVWQARLETLAADKRAELERQESLVSELTARLESLQARVQQREEVLVEGGGAHLPQLAQEVQIWRARHLALEQETAIQVAAVRARAAAADEFEGRLEEVELERSALAAETEQLRERLTQANRAHELRVAESEAREAEHFAQQMEDLAVLEARILELMPHVEGERAAREERDRYFATCEEQRARQAELSAQFERTRSGLEGELQVTRSARAAENSAYEERLDELENDKRQRAEELAELRAELEQSRAAARESEIACAEQERLRQELETNLQRSQEQLAQISVARDGLQRELEGQLEALEEVCASLRGATLEHQARIAELETTAGALERELGAARKEHGELRERARQADAERAAQVEELEQSLAGARAESRLLREQAERAEAERASQMRALEEQFAALEEISSSLREAAEEHLGRIAELETHGQDLERTLDDRTRDLVHTAGRLEDAERTLQAAFALLAQAQEAEHG